MGPATHFWFEMNDTTSNASTDFALLSASLFEGLCFALFRALGYRLNPLVDERQHFGDFEGTGPARLGEKTVLVEVKHRDKFDAVSLRQFCLRSVETAASNLVYVTSASIPSKYRGSLQDDWVPDGKSLQLFGREELHEMLRQKSGIRQQFFGPAKRQARMSKLKASVGIAFLAVSVPWAFYERSGATQTSRATLPDEIAAVQQSLQNIRNLQDSLQRLQQKLDDMSVESRRINDEYAKAQQLKRLTASQLDEVKAALNQSSLLEWFETWGIGFVTGVAGSLVASWVWDKWVRRRERAGFRE